MSELKKLDEETILEWYNNAIKVTNQDDLINFSNDLISNYQVEQLSYDHANQVGAIVTAYISFIEYIMKFEDNQVVKEVRDHLNKLSL